MKTVVSLLFATLFALPVQAQAVGAVEFRAILMLFMGPLGLAVGLIVVVFGIWAFFVSQKFMRGLILVALGVAISSFPVLFKGIRQDLYPIANDLGGSGSGSDFSEYLQ